MRGIITYLKMPKGDEGGWGFIEKDNAEKNDPDIYFTEESLQGSLFEELRVGDTVEFELMENPEGSPETKSMNKIES